MTEEELAAQAAEKAAQAAKAAEDAAALEALKAKQEAGDELTEEEKAALGVTADEEELIVTIGDETPPKEEKAPAWVKELRAQHKEQARQLRELQEENSRLKTPTTQQVGTKPTLESCDYDEAKFETSLTAWHDAKRNADSAKQAKIDAEAAEKKAWHDKLAAYEESKKELKIPDFEDAESMAQMRLNTTQQGIILHGASKPAVLFYALGKNPAELDRLAAIEDPVKFAFAVAQLEATVKTSKKTPPAPEKQPPAGGKSGAGALDNVLEKLRDEAAKTGDYTKLHQYKRDQAAKAAK